MHYYDKKAKAYGLILELIKEETPEPFIIHKLMINFGFNKKFYDDCIKTIENLK